MSNELSLIETLVNTLGAPGIILICMGAPSLVMAFMYADHRRVERDRLETAQAQGRRDLQHRDEMAVLKEQYLHIIAQQEKRFEMVVKNYENNVLLVENYQKLSNELAGIIHMSTQVMTRLVEKIDNNMYCPISKERK